ncbi:hypothetical protein SAMN05421541_11781 [Actinoplanes philippinensis]|uniref:Uncharacterized protein n=1 Tax=Actinoplanes philippinensis TaxID=35752 RepID=A0A1I2KPJ6_9ACTN|nr:hypothetical protein SAMN05421541_11781 [Actinoplanes philippinensis]
MRHISSRIRYVSSRMRRRVLRYPPPGTWPVIRLTAGTGRDMRRLYGITPGGHPRRRRRGSGRGVNRTRGSTGPMRGVTGRTRRRAGPIRRSAAGPIGRGAGPGRRRAGRPGGPTGPARRDAGRAGRGGVGGARGGGGCGAAGLRGLDRAGHGARGGDGARGGGRQRAFAVPLSGLDRWGRRAGSRRKRCRTHRSGLGWRQERHVHGAGPIVSGDLAGPGGEDGEGGQRGEADEHRHDEHVAPGRAGEAQVFAVHPVESLAQHFEGPREVVVSGQVRHAKLLQTQIERQTGPNSGRTEWGRAGRRTGRTTSGSMGRWNPNAGRDRNEKINLDPFRSLGMNDGTDGKERHERGISTEVTRQNRIKKTNAQARNLDS